MDFTLSTYKRLLETLQSHGYPFQTFEQFTANPLEKVVVLRHDVDRLPRNALEMALLEKGLGVRGS
jgi:hypothetical protein